LDILEMKDLLPFLARTNSNSKESYVIHLISEVEIEKPMTESYSRSTPKTTKFTRSCDNNNFLTTTAAIKLSLMKIWIRSL
jgi:hypothetical protein